MTNASLTPAEAEVREVAQAVAGVIDDPNRPMPVIGYQLVDAEGYHGKAYTPALLVAETADALGITREVTRSWVDVVLSHVADMGVEPVDVRVDAAAQDVANTARTAGLRSMTALQGHMDGNEVVADAMERAGLSVDTDSDAGCFATTNAVTERVDAILATPEAWMVVTATRLYGPYVTREEAEGVRGHVGGNVAHLTAEADD